MDLYLLRHGIAAAHDPARFPDDSLRPLTARGKRQADEIADAIGRMNLGIDLIWCSPFLRTHQTAAPVASKLGLGDRLQPQQQLSPDGDPGKLLAKVASLEPNPDNLLLVGHEPYLSRLLSVVASGRENLMAEFKKGGLARLEISGPLGLHQCAVLKWLLPPRLLVKIGR